MKGKRKKARNERKRDKRTNKIAVENKFRLKTTAIRAFRINVTEYEGSSKTYE
jgi:hypothetical protein